MGNKLVAVRPARHILSAYRRTTVSQIVDVLKSFKSKYSFQAALLSRDDFAAISKSCTSVVCMHPSSVSVPSLAVAHSSCYCSPRTIPQRCKFDI
jgi:hypothetical protein